MQLVRVLVPDERRSDVAATLDERGFDHVVTAGGGRFEGESVVEVPVSDEAVENVTDALAEAGVDLDRYLVVEDLRRATTPRAESVREGYAGRYDPPSRDELRSLVDSLNWDTYSFAALLSLSAVIAAIGMVLDSPVVVVGSAVIAPIINPILITGLGTVLGERWMVRKSLRLQALGLVVAAGSAFAVGASVEALGLVPATLDLPTIDLVKTRLAPSALAVLVGAVSGAAAAVSLTAEASLINIVGVMIAAALIPVAAATGIALAWGYPLIALGSALLVVTTVVAVDLAILATFSLLGYRPPAELFSVPSRGAAARLAAAALVLGTVLVGTWVATAGQVAFERDANAAIDEVVSDPEYEGVTTVAVRSEYADYSPFTGPETVIVELSRIDGESHPELADRIADRIADETGREVDVQVEFADRQESS